ncbi:MAG: hypothetical protein J0I49_10010 [Pseudonocardia sp.]|uniref:VC0807 family protein n=1 Tax=Pseudonocardia sp. TaxID=60912 RepID=UPI001AD5C834|nr:VC0807 family protein [Pseudonocardia sp.]MBN9098427.1 hypothetical protein [Pseudonocardia sp.]
MRTLVVDLAAPLVVYYVLHACGVDDVVALAAGGAPPALTVVVTALRRRRVEVLALAVVLSMVVGLAGSLVGGSPRELLARGAWLSAPLALYTLVTLWSARPMCFEVTRALLPRRVAVMDELWETNARFRRAWREITVMWGALLTVDAGLRVVMASTLPVSTVPALDTALTLATTVILQVPTHLLLRRSGCWEQLFRPRQGRARKSVPGH